MCRLDSFNLLCFCALKPLCQAVLALNPFQSQGGTVVEHAVMLTLECQNKAKQHESLHLNGTVNIKG